MALRWKSKADKDLLCTHQVAEVAQRVPGQLHDALREAPVVADEAGEDRGQAVAGSVQHHSGGSLHCYLGDTTLRGATGKNDKVRLLNKNRNCRAWLFDHCYQLASRSSLQLSETFWAGKFHIISIV